jgi:hypothetical protein
LKLGDRLRGYLYRAGLRVVPVDDLANMIARITELGRYSHELARAVIEAPTVVTVIVFGERAGEMTPAQIRAVETSLTAMSPAVRAFGREARLVVVDSVTRTLKYDQTETIELKANFPVRDFQVVVLADLQRLDDVKIFARQDLLAWAAPVAFGGELQVGELVRVVCRTRGVRS